MDNIQDIFTKSNISDFFYSVFENSSVLMTISTVNGGAFIDANTNCLIALGYSRDELIGKTPVDLNIFVDDHQREAIFQKIRKYGFLSNEDILIKRKDGVFMSYLVSIYKVKIGKDEYYLSVSNDISKLKNTEKQLNHLYEHQKLIADISQLLSNPDLLESSLNDILKILGVHSQVSRIYIFENSQDGLTTSNTYEWCNENITPQIDELKDLPYEMFPLWKKMLINEGRVFSTDIYNLPEEIVGMLEPQGIKSILVYPMMVSNEYFGFIGFDECIINRFWSDDEIDLLRTISNMIASTYERKIIIKKLKDSELRLSLALSSAKEGIWDWNIVTNELTVNDVWSEMLGYDSRHFVPDVSSWKNRVHPDDLSNTLETLEKHLSGKSDIYEAIYRARKNDGSWVWILDHGMVVERDSENKPVRAIGTNIDITKQKETELELEELVQTKNKIFSIIAHDLRGPIGSFMPILDILTGDIKIEESEKKFFLEELKVSAKSTFELLDNLLNWSRSQTQSINLSPGNYPVDLIIDNIINVLKPLAQGKSISITKDTNDILSVYVDIDTISLVLRNLIANSIKFTSENGQIVVGAVKSCDMVNVFVKDTGVGMTDSVLTNLFKVKFNPSTRGTNNETGSGLGLVLCKDFVEKNCGKIWAESELGNGTTFTFSVPVSSNN